MAKSLDVVRTIHFMINNMEDNITPESLVNLASIATAKNVSCEELKRHHPQLDVNLLKKVARFACPEDEDGVKAIADVALYGKWGRKVDYKHNVKDMIQVGFMVTAVVDNTDVYFTFEKQNIISSSCTLCSVKKLSWCTHVIAAIIYRIRHPDNVPIYVPVTESLSALNRDQLLKLIQYAIEEDPAKILGNAFKRLKQVCATKSKIVETPYPPDKTFRTSSDIETTLDLTLNDLSVSFTKACGGWIAGFPCSYDESRTHTHYLYKSYIQRAIDLVQTDQIEAGGKVLITLITVAGNVESKLPAHWNKRYKFLLKNLERICSLYILLYPGKARKDLIIRCQNVNKTLRVVPHYSTWAEIPPLSLMLPYQSPSEPGIMAAKQASMFYEPLCLSVVPDPTKDFYELIEGKIKPVDSGYNEPLPLMILRFESIRMFDESEQGERKLLRLGAVILWKLLQASQNLSILTLNCKMKLDKTNSICKKRRHDSDDTESGIAQKKPKSSGSMKGTSLDQDDTVTENMEHVSCDETVEADDESDVLIEMNEIIAETKSDYLETVDTEDTATFPLQTMLETLDRTKLQADTDILPKENLSFCLSHICVCMYQVSLFFKYLSETERGILALASLRALELSRYRIESDKRNELCREEESALKSTVAKLFVSYGTSIRRLLKPLGITFLHRLYMMKLCQCNTGVSCFFNNAVPLPLVEFLLKRDFKTHSFTDESNSRARNLCLYMLCHSNKPLTYYENTSQAGNYTNYCELHRQWLKSFKNIMSLFLNHLKDFPERNFYLTALLKYYSKLHDGTAMFFLWDKLRRFPMETLSEDVLVRLLEFRLHCIDFNNNIDQTYRFRYRQGFHSAMEFLCEKLGPKFTNYALENLRELEKFDSAWLLSLLEGLKISMTAETPMSEDMGRFVIRYFSGDWEHPAEISCKLLNLFEKNDERLGKVFDAILNNASKFTTMALLGIAETNMECKLTSISSESEEPFTDFAEKAIKLALKRIEQGKTRVTTHTSRNCDKDCDSSIFSSKPDPRIQWVFQRFLTGSERTVTACRQLTDIVCRVREAYKNDLCTILSLFDCVEKHKPILEKVKLLCGEIVVKLAKKSLFEAVDSLTTTHYRVFTEDLDKVQAYFYSYISDGNRAFKDLLLDIKRQNMSKKQLIKAIKTKYKC